MPSAPLPFSQLRAGLTILLEAFDWATGSQIDPQDFAVGIGQLLDAGLSVTHLRWLISADHLEHALELTLTGDEKRSFRRFKTLKFHKRSCFFLSQSGAAFARPICAKGTAEETSREAPAKRNRNTPESPAPVKPHWDGRLLTVGEKVVKRYHRPAKAQELILASFEEEHWPDRIDDPLPRIAGRDPKVRLRGVIESLNQKHLTPLIHFYSDGKGEGVCWILVPS
ncbi:MAG: hypothetical protein ACM3U2_20195 [Deltaproteobacteria bacterium]